MQHSNNLVFERRKPIPALDKEFRKAEEVRLLCDQAMSALPPQLSEKIVLFDWTDIVYDAFVCHNLQVFKEEYAGDDDVRNALIAVTKKPWKHHQPSRRGRNRNASPLPPQRAARARDRLHAPRHSLHSERLPRQDQIHPLRTDVPRLFPTHLLQAPHHRQHHIGRSVFGGSSGRMRRELTLSVRRSSCHPAAQREVFPPR